MIINCNKRRLLKTLTWRIIASSTTFTIAYLIQGKIGDAGLITLLDSSLKTIFYYLHERIYYKSPDNKTITEVVNIEKTEENV